MEDKNLKQGEVKVSETVAADSTKKDGTDDQKNNESTFTEVKNANAAGIGAMGRTEKKVPGADDTSSSSSDKKTFY